MNSFLPIPMHGFPGFDLGWFSTSGFAAPNSRMAGSFEPQGHPKVRSGYEVLFQLGQGAQGSVWLARKLTSKKFYALKETRDFEISHGEPMEVRILSDIIGKHKNIVQLMDYDFAFDSRLLLYYDFCAGGDLETLMKRSNAVREEACVWNLFLQLADAIAFLHYGYDCTARHPDEPHRKWQRVVHGDIKPGNVFLKEPFRDGTFPKIVLGDFGSATLKEVTYGPFMCDMRYQGPEQAGAQEYREMTAKCDVWCVGAIIHELGTRHLPLAALPRGYNINEWMRDPRARDPVPLDRDYYSKKLNVNMMDAPELDLEDRIKSRKLVKNLLHDMPRH